MIKTISKAFELLRDNIIIIQPLIFYLLILGVISRPISFEGNFTLDSVFAIIISVLLTVAFLSGWFYITKLAISLKDKVYESIEEKNLAQLSLLKQFFTGVGEYFIPVLFAFLLYTVVFISFSYFAYKFGIEHIGKLVLTPDLVKALNTGSSKDLIKLLNSPESYQSIKLMAYWGFYISGLGLIFSFLTMYYGPAIVYDTKNPIKALFINLKFLFSNFMGSIFILLFLTFLNMLLSLFNVLSAMNIIFSVISLLLMFLYMGYHVVLIFLYYDEKTQSNSNRGPERIGEIEPGN